MDIYETAPEAVSFADDVAASPRSNLIAEIKNIWPRFAPGLPLATELIARFGKSSSKCSTTTCFAASAWPSQCNRRTDLPFRQICLNGPTRRHTDEQRNFSSRESHPD